MAESENNCTIKKLVALHKDIRTLLWICSAIFTLLVSIALKLKIFIWQ
jgi:hypothetical protein